MNPDDEMLNQLKSVQEFNLHPLPDLKSNLVTLSQKTANVLPSLKSQISGDDMVKVELRSISRDISFKRPAWEENPVPFISPI